MVCEFCIYYPVTSADWLGQLFEDKLRIQKIDTVHVQSGTV